MRQQPPAHAVPPPPRSAPPTPAAILRRRHAAAAATWMGPAQGPRKGRTEERRSPVFEIDLEQAAVAAEEALDVLLPDVVAQTPDVDARHVRGRRGGEEGRERN